MYIKFLKDFTYRGIEIGKEGETNFIKDEMLASYIVRKRIGIKSF